jgi:dihydrofolate reductase
MISAIVAVDNNWGIGFNGDLLEHIPDDLKYFKAITTGSTVIMGRKTWDSLPKKPLPDRLNIVITSTPRENEENVKFMTLEEAKAYAIVCRPQNVFIIGGGEIYKKLLPICKRVYITKIYKDHSNVDTYFPNLDEMNEWAPAACSSIHDYKDLKYQFWQYDRIN